MKKFNSPLDDFGKYWFSCKLPCYFHSFLFVCFLVCLSFTVVEEEIIQCVLLPVPLFLLLTFDLILLYSQLSISYPEPADPVVKACFKLK